MSEISWGPLRNGFGTWVMAILRPGGQQEGSRPTPPRLKDAPGWEQLGARKQLNGKPLYVRGHLLHHEAGGPGVDYNEVILTAASGGDFGANHANFLHRYSVEGPLLWAIRNMHSNHPTITEIYYEVNANYDRAPRKGTQELRQIAEAYWQTAQLLQAKFRDSLVTHQEIIGQLSFKPPYLQDAMSAVSAEMGEEWENVYDRIVANQELWQLEDTNIPKTLTIRYSWLEHGRLSKSHEETVSIVLPSSLAAKFKS